VNNKINTKQPFIAVWCDAISVGLSTVCIVHCLLLPLFMTTFPLLGIELLENMYLEGFMVLLSAFIGGNAIRKGYLQYHRKMHITVLFLTGFILMIAGNFLSYNPEAALKLSGATLVIWAHVQNWRLSRSCPRI
jgi:hypothetical protein